MWTFWKAAVIVPMLKPGKPANEGASYCPISLLSPAVKVLERLFLHNVTAALPKNPSQHRFASLHCYMTALLPIVTRVTIGFNDRKPACRSAMCAVDISKAFDAINHVWLIEMILGTNLHPNLVRWLKAYITGHRAWCMYGLKSSSQFILCSGVPQGSVLSPAIFNFYVSDCPTNGDILESYADDFSLLESDANLAALAEKLLISAGVDKVPKA
jgi:hypothetical protein